jgi:ubiquinone/menaquinone biosynthesis C-methylase UbiE
VTDTQTVRKLFDDLAGDYDKHVPFFETFGRRLVDWCGLRPGQRVLDIAAGRGAVTAPAALAVGPRGAVLAVDNAPRMLRALAADHRNIPQLATSVMDAHRLGARDACFEVVTCGFAFHFLDEPQRAITEAHRVLRPGGLLAFSQPAADQPLGSDGEPGRQRDDRWDFYRELMTDMAGRADEATNPDPFTPPPRPLPEICTEAGFTVIEQRTVRASFAIRDPQHYWAWIMSHGFRGYIDSLGPRLAAEFRARMLAGLERVHASGGITLDGTVAFTRARKA